MTRGCAALALALVAFAGRAGADDKLVPTAATSPGGCKAGGCGAAASAPCGAACRPCRRSCLEQIRDWFTYRPCPVPCQCTCWATKVNICYPPLYTFFLHQKGERCKAATCDTCCPARGHGAACGDGGCAGGDCRKPLIGLLQR